MGYSNFKCATCSALHVHVVVTTFYSRSASIFGNLFSSSQFYCVKVYVSAILFVYFLNIYDYHDLLAEQFNEIIIVLF